MTSTAAPAPYVASMTHILTIAAIYTPYGQPIVNSRQIHADNCTDTRCAR